MRLVENDAEIGYVIFEKNGRRFQVNDRWKDDGSHDFTTSDISDILAWLNHFKKVQQRSCRM